MGAEGFRLQGRRAGVMGAPGGQEEGLPQSCTLQKTRRGDQGVAASPPAGPPPGSWLAGPALTRPPRPAPAAGDGRRGSREARLGVTPLQGTAGSRWGGDHSAAQPSGCGDRGRSLGSGTEGPPRPRGREALSEASVALPPGMSLQ